MDVNDAIRDEERFLRQFEDCSFPRTFWFHRPHVTVAYLYLRGHSLDESIVKLRDGIKAYNASVGAHDGYHETATQFWARMIHFCMQAHGPSENAWHFFNYHTYLTNKMLPLMYYSHPRIMSVEARECYLEPDVQPIPVWQGQLTDSRDLRMNYSPVPIPPEPYAMIQRWTRAVEENPNDWLAYMRRGEMHLARADYDPAERDLRRSIALKPEEYWHYFLLGQLLANKPDVRASIEQFQKSRSNGNPYIKGAGKGPHVAKILELPEFQAFLREIEEVPPA